ncbi:MAG: undecaprenyl/decaprenyl-phosphate alpha-N-acetylglucosaminyl 1-phosphate transferase [Clostridia bacterium]|nr:undecaprenyl/decaprenyl-phosphate alpha-N-acetylglucosaminyl 1-phosphate transferase [Clostridia bacterium]
MNNNILLAFILAFIITFIATPFVKNLAFKIGAVDIPKDNRRMHKRPTARLGGLAIFLGFIISAIIFSHMNCELAGILIGCCIIVTLGVFDDIYALSAKLKLAIQLIAALCPVIAGVCIDFVRVPSFISEYGYVGLGWAAIPVTMIWIVGITNAINLLDGLDGLACGVSSISALTLLCIAIIVGEPGVAFITSALAGACFGFLPYNFNPAKLFMGDTGSLFLGFVLASISVQGLFKGYAVISIAAPLLILGLPIFDTASAILRRLKNHQPIMSPDRGHLHHRLIDAGFSQKQAVSTIYLLCIILCAAAVLLIATGAISWWVLLAVLLGFTLFLWLTPLFIELRSEKEDSGSNYNKRNQEDKK